MIARALVIAALVAAAAPAQAGSREQLLRLVAQDFRELGIRDVDPNSLSTHKLGTIHQITHLKRPRAGKRALIRSTIGGRDTLRSLIGLSN